MGDEKPGEFARVVRNWKHPVDGGVYELVLLVGNEIIDSMEWDEFSEGHFQGVADRMNATIRARVDEEVSFTKKQAAMAVQGKHSLVGDAVFFTMIEKEVQRRVDEALERAAEIIVSFQWNRNKKILVNDIRALKSAGESKGAE